MARVLPKIQVWALLSNPYDSSSLTTAVEITPYVRTLTITWGRQHELQVIEPGTIRMTLTSRTFEFLPWVTNRGFCNLFTLQNSFLYDGTPGSWVNKKALSTTPSTTSASVGGGGVGSSYATLHVAAGSAIFSGKITTTGYKPTVSTAHTHVIAVTPGKYYNFAATIFAYTGATKARLTVYWGKTSTHVTSASTLFSLGATERKRITLTGAVAPANCYAAVVKISATTNPLQCNRFTAYQRIVNSYYSGGHLDITKWGPGQVGLGPGRSIIVTNTRSGSKKILGFGYVETQTMTKATALDMSVDIVASDVLKLLSNRTVNSALYPGYVLSFSPYLYWRFGDEFASKVANDTSLSNNVGFANPTVITWRSTSALTTDLTTSALITGQPATTGKIVVTTRYATVTRGTVSTFHGFTVNFWVKFPPFAYRYTGKSTAGYGVRIYTGATSTKWMSVTVVTTGTTTAKVLVRRNTGSVATAATLTRDTNFHQITASYNNTYSTKTTRLRVWVDGTITPQYNSTTFLGNSWLTSSTHYVTKVSVQTPNATIVPVGNIQDLSLWLRVATTTKTVPSGKPSTVYIVTSLYILGTQGWYGRANTIPLNSTKALYYLLIGNNTPPTSVTVETGNSDINLLGAVNVGTTNLGSVSQQIMATEQGALFQIGLSSSMPDEIYLWNRHHAFLATRSVNVQATFANTTVSTVIPYMPTVAPTKTDLTLWNAIPTKNVGTATTYLALTSDSVNVYTKRSLQGYTACVYYTPRTAAALGQYLLGNYLVPLTRIRSITTSSIMKTGIGVTAQGNLRFLDLVTVTYYPLGYAGPTSNPAVFKQISQIEHIQHKIVPGVQWTTTYILTPYSYSTRKFLRTAATTSGATPTTTPQSVLSGPGYENVQNRIAF